MLSDRCSSSDNMDEEGGEDEDKGVNIEANVKRAIKFDDFEVYGDVVYCREGVIVQAKKEDRLHSGTLRVIETKQGAFVTWDLDLPVQQSIKVSGDGCPKEGQQEKAAINDYGVPSYTVGSPPTSDWAVVADSNGTATPLQRVRFQPSTSDCSPAVSFSSHLEEKQLKLIIEITEIKSYKLSDDGNQVTIMMKDGTLHNSLIFLDEGPDDFLLLLTRFVCIKKSKSDSSLYMLSDKRIAALDQSLSQLNLDMDRDRSNSEVVWRTINHFQKDPYTTGLTIFSKITDMILYSPGEETRPEEEMAELLQGEPSSLVLGAGLDVSQAEPSEEGDKADWQVVTSRTGCLMATVQAVGRASPLCQLDWELHIDADGTVTQVPQLLEKIFQGGIEENIRPEVWKFLLGYYQWHQPAEVRETNRKARVEEYFRMKLQWKSMSEDQQNRFSGFRERKTQIEKDIGRTDRSHPFYEGEKNPNVALLEEILMTYVMYNFDLGYVQGMSDLLSPLLFVMKNEVDAFWCFAGFMDRVASNFEFDQGGMKRQLEELCHLLRYVDPVFYSYLDTKDSGNLYFCFRWLLIWFKREFNYPDTMLLWEVLWTKVPCKNFHLLICVALLDTEKSSIVENKYGFTEVLKHVNDMSHRIDLEACLSKAHGIFIALQEDDKVPEKVVNILGLAPRKIQPSAAPQAEGISNSETMKLEPPRTKPVPIRVPGGAKSLARERHGTEGSNNSCASLDNSSSVEVLSELEDEQKFETGLNHGFF